MYIAIFILSTIFAYCYTKSQKLENAIIFYLLCFFSLFIPAALRGGIGTDYFNYIKIYNIIRDGRYDSYATEPITILIAVFLSFFNFPGHVFIICYSLLTILFVFLSIPKKYFYLGIPVYVMVFYLDSYCLLRQGLGCAVFLYALRKYIENQKKDWVIFSVIAMLCHNVLAISFILILLSNFFPIIRNKYYRFLFIFVLFVLVFFTKSFFVSFIFEQVLKYTPFSGYSRNIYSSLKSENNTGMGFLLQIMILMFIFFVLSPKKNKHCYKICGIFLVYLIVARCLQQEVYIMVRMVNSVTFIYVLFLIYISLCKSKIRILSLVFISFALFVLYTRSFTPISNTGTGAGKQIYPYTFIWSYEDNDILLARRRRILGY